MNNVLHYVTEQPTPRLGAACNDMDVFRCPSINPGIYHSMEAAKNCDVVGASSFGEILSSKISLQNEQAVIARMIHKSKNKHE